MEIFDFVDLFIQVFQYFFLNPITQTWKPWIYAPETLRPNKFVLSQIRNETFRKNEK
jgi:hypothetical protein